MAECKFYELDKELKAEADATDEYLRKTYGEDAFSEPEVDPDPSWPELLNLCCGQLCKWMRSGEGYPGETCYACTHPECGRIIHTEFDPNAVM